MKVETSHDTLAMAVRRSSSQTLEGYVCAPTNPAHRYVVELFLDGAPAKLARADLFDRNAPRDVGDQCYGFVFDLAPEDLIGASRAEVRIANSGQRVGVVDLRLAPAPAGESATPGHVRWLGGLKFAGWTAGRRSSAPPIVRGVVDGDVVTETAALGWVHAPGSEASVARGFTIDLPPYFADGRVRTIEFLTEAGDALPGGPVTFLAFDDPLEHLIGRFGELESEIPRGRLFDRLFPRSTPCCEFASWLDRYPPPRRPGTEIAIAVVLVGETRSDESSESLQQQSHEHWLAITVPTDADDSCFSADVVADFLRNEARHCALVVFAHNGAHFAPQALEALAAALDDHPQSSLAYTDLRLRDAQGREWPLALTAFDYERALEQGYLCHCFAVRHQTALEATGAGASSLYAIALGNLHADAADARNPVHAPGFHATLPALDLEKEGRALAKACAAHLERAGLSAEVTPGKGAMFPAVRARRAATGERASILLAERPGDTALPACLRALEPLLASGRAEIIVVGSADFHREALLHLRKDRHAEVRTVEDDSVNFSRRINRAAAEAQAEHLLVFDPALEARDPDFLDELQSRLADPAVGAVGALACWPDGVITHAGVLLGPEFSVCELFRDRLADDPGPLDLLRVAHETSAISPTCLLTRRSLFEAVGGLDEVRFAKHLSGIDYCLKLRALQKRIVLAPAARLTDHGSPSCDRATSARAAALLARETANLRVKWGECLLDDPYYNPLLSLDAAPFASLASPPRHWRARPLTAPTPRLPPPGL